MPVSSEHPDYVDGLKKWCLTRAIVDNDAKKYLPDVDDRDPNRNKRYKNDAILTNFTALTKNGLLGLIFLNEPKEAVPEQLNYILENATGSGISLDDLSQKVCGELLETGRMGILVDCPTLDEPDGDADDNAAMLIPYAAESIINWRTHRIDGKEQFMLVVLKEQITVPVSEDDIYNLEKQEQYRVLRLNNGVYVQEVYDRYLNLIGSTVPTKADGSFFEYIPFVIMGTENNDADIDNATLYDLAVLNLGHYKNSADYEESIFITGQPTVIINIGDIPADQWKEINGDRFKFGSRGGHIIGSGGSAQLLQANPNQLAGAAMKDKELAAIGIGARIISPPGGRETAEAARIRYSSQNSALYILTKNVNNGIIEALEYACEFTPEANPDLIQYELNDQFYEDGADATLLAQAILMFDRNIISGQEIRTYIESSGAGLVLESEIPEIQNNPLED